MAAVIADIILGFEIAGKKHAFAFRAFLPKIIRHFLGAG
jgi:hypothetical protein